MRNFWIVLKFEILNFYKNKSFIIASVIICGLLIIGMSIPTIRDTFFSSSEDSIGEEVGSDQTYGFINSAEGDVNSKTLGNQFMGGELQEFDDREALDEAVQNGDLAAGFVIVSPTEYQHVIQNNEMTGSTHFMFEEAFRETYRITGFESLGIEYETVQGLVHAPIQRDTVVLGTDSAANYLYTYILVFGLYFVIIVYGQLVATSVASEKSNRAMEVLVTSTRTENLIFGKVFGGAIAGASQLALIIATAMIAYRANSNAWDGGLDFIFDIPLSVLGSFAAFGILGYLFFLFLFGALGALVSRTEDVSTSVTPITIIFVAVFAVSVMGMQNTEGMLLRVASFVPLSSFMAMFVRVSMGSVTNVEVAISLGILLATTLFTGWLASKIYRMGTLMYGNPVKITKVFKMLFSSNEA